MENDKTENRGPDTPQELRPTSINVQTDKTPKKPTSRKQQSKKDKKWSLVRHWRAANRKQQMIWLGELVGGLIALGVLATYIIGDIQNYLHTKMEREHFSMEHRPRLEFFREPALVDQFACSRHGTCNTYRFVKSDGNTDLSCKESPISGKFERMLWGYCEN